MNAGDNDSALAIRPARPDDLARIVELLTGCSLPASDLSAAHLANFLVATAGDRLVGVAGVELLENVGLLRSLAVAPDYRNSGLAHRLVTTCEERAKSLHEVSDLYLLTTTAAGYFLQRGYGEVPRASVPRGVAAHPCRAASLRIRSFSDCVRPAPVA